MNTNNLNNKLLKVERFINIYRNNDNESIEEINIDHVSLNFLNEIVCQKNDDPLLYDGYVLSEIQLQAINKFLENKITPNFVLYFYVLECAGIYDWGK